MSFWNNNIKNNQYFKNSTSCTFAHELDNILCDYSKNNNSKMIQQLLPIKIVMIGDGSINKNRLLQNIIGVSIFPIYSNICNRQPLHLVLKNVTNTDDILYKVTFKNITIIITDKSLMITEIEKIINYIHINDISKDEIHIEMSDLELPNLEIYDLPDIQTYSDELMNKTIKLTDYYLNQPNIIVLCVISTISSYNMSSVLKTLIKKHNKVENTIIALNMIDHVKQCKIDKLIINKIINKLESIDKLDSIDCLLVTNNSHDYSNVDESFINDIPNNVTIEQENKLKSIIGMSNLINRINILCIELIKHSVITNNLSELKSCKLVIDCNINRLGTTIKDFNKSNFNSVIDLCCSQLYLPVLTSNNNSFLISKLSEFIKNGNLADVNFTTFYNNLCDYMCTNMLDTDIRYKRCLFDNGIPPCVFTSRYQCELKLPIHDLKKHTSDITGYFNYFIYNSSLYCFHQDKYYFVNVINKNVMIEKNVHDHDSEIMGVIHDNMITHISDSYITNNNLNIIRFDKLINKIINNIKIDYSLKIREHMEINKSNFYNIYYNTELLDEADDKYVNCLEYLIKMLPKIVNNVVNEVRNKTIKEIINEDAYINLTECDEYKNLRHISENKLKYTVNTIDKINNLINNI